MSRERINLLLNYLEGIYLPQLREPIINFYEKHLLDDEKNILACLRFLESQKNPADRQFYKTLLKHAAWPVRVRAIHALKKVMTPDDTTHFAAKLQDENWWVRYRAAQVLVTVPSFNIKEFIKNNSAPKALEILSLATFEKA